MIGQHTNNNFANYLEFLNSKRDALYEVLNTGIDYYNIRAAINGIENEISGNYKNAIIWYSISKLKWAKDSLIRLNSHAYPQQSPAPHYTFYQPNQHYLLQQPQNPYQLSWPSTIISGHSAPKMSAYYPTAQPMAPSAHPSVTFEPPPPSQPPLPAISTTITPTITITGPKKPTQPSKKIKPSPAIYRIERNKEIENDILIALKEFRDYSREKSIKMQDMALQLDLSLKDFKAYLKNLHEDKLIEGSWSSRGPAITSRGNALYWKLKQKNLSSSNESKDTPAYQSEEDNLLRNNRTLVFTDYSRKRNSNRNASVVTTTTTVSPESLKERMSITKLLN